MKFFFKICRNFFFSWIWKIIFFFSPNNKKYFIEIIVEDANWAIKRFGESICEEILKNSNITIKTSSKPYKSLANVIHFCSQYMWLDWEKYMSKSNYYVVSYFHGKPEDGPEIEEHVEKFLKSVHKISKIIVSNTIVENRLIGWGISPSKIVRIPIGVDLDIFTIPTNSEKFSARQFYNLPNSSFVIGSFQKDGVGWGEGIIPKPVKGPDIFLETIDIIRKKINVSVLLTGPARGYIKVGLEEMGVPYSHIFVEDYSDLKKCYHALDLYLISSREEGGPMALMESMASGVVVASTPVGMAQDFVINGRNGVVSDFVDSTSLSEGVLSVYQMISDNMINKENVRSDIQSCSWKVVAESHLQFVYNEFIE